MKELKNFCEDKTILITGGVGSIGSELVRKIIEYNPGVVRILDNNETGLFNLEEELKSEKIRLFVGAVKDKARLRRAIEDVDIIFHAAALKYAPLCEYNPFEAVKTNVIGTQNLIDVALDENVEKFITISTEWSAPLSEFIFKPNVFVDIKDTFQLKIKATEQYKGIMKEYPHPRSMENLEALAKYRGAQSGFELAEAFMLMRELR